MITYEEALKRATNPDDFALKVKGIHSTSDLTFDSQQAKPDELKIDRFGS